MRLSEEQDTLIWNGTTSGKFSCQSAYQILHEQNYPSQPLNKDWNYLWKSKLSNKMKHFLWLASRDRLLTIVHRHKRYMTNDPSCVQCNGSEETVLHLLRHCVTAKRIWEELIPQPDLRRFKEFSDRDWFRLNLQGNFATNLNMVICWPAVFTTTFWALWKSRNAKIFKGKPETTQLILFLIKQQRCDLDYKMNPRSNFQNTLHSLQE